MRKRSRKGYILLTTIFLVVIVTAALAGLCRKYLDKAIQTHRQAETLQLRWGMRSISKAVMPKIETLLQKGEADTEKPLAQLHQELVLGECKFDVVIADEQAKFDINAFYLQKSEQALSEALSHLMSGQGIFLPVEPAPLPQNNDPSESYRPFTSYNQIFPDIKEQALLPVLLDEPEVLDYISFFSNGKINFLRANCDVMLAYCTPDLTQKDIQDLIELRDESPVISLSKAMEKLKFSDEKVKKAHAILTDRSSVHSILCIGKTKNTRKWAEYVCVSDKSVSTAAHNFYRWAWQD